MSQQDRTRWNKRPSRSRHLRAAVLASFGQPDEQLTQRLGAFSQEQWRRHLSWLDSSGLALYLLDRLQAAGMQHLLPSVILSRLQQNLRDNKERNEQLLTESFQISRAWEEEGLTFVALKGITLTPESVPNPSLRCQLDLDFLVAKEHAEAAARVLASFGYTRQCISGSTWEFKAGASVMAKVKDLYKAKPQRCAELHLASVSGPLARRQTRIFAGSPLPVLAPADLFIAQALHLFKHVCDSFTRASWLLEFHRHLLARSADETFWRDLNALIAGDPKISLAIAVVSRLSAQIFRTSLPPVIERLIEHWLPAPAALWIEQYGHAYLLTSYPGSKLNLLLLAALAPDAASPRSERRMSLIPLSLPPMITLGLQEGDPDLASAASCHPDAVHLLSTPLSLRGRCPLLHRASPIPPPAGRAHIVMPRFQSVQPKLRGCFLALSFALASASAHLHAQQQVPPGAVDARPSSSAVMTSQDDSFENHAADTRAVLTASQITDLLRDKPEIVVELKQLTADQLQQQGLKVQSDAITDEVLYNQIAASRPLRIAITNFLRARGYTTGPDVSSSDGEDNDIRDETRNPSFRLPQNQDSTTLDADTLERLNQQSNGSSARMARPSTQAPTQTTRTPLDMERVPSSRPSSRDPEEHNTTDIPQVLRQPTPYNLQSMRDLYTQTPEESGHLKRFGSDVFLTRRTPDPSIPSTLTSTNSINNPLQSRDTPLDIPIGPDYVLGPGDGLIIDLWGGVSQTLNRVVEREGRVTLPEAGTLSVAGMTLEHAEAVMQDTLRKQFRDAHVAVTVSRLRTVRVFVIGDVQRPGAYDISSLSTPLNALFAAGGPTAIGSLRTVRHLRGKQVIADVDLYDFLLHGDRSSDDRFQGGDTLLVPPAGPQVAIFGAVKRPAIYELKHESTLADVLADAGGATVAAALGHITIERIDANNRRETVALDLPASASLAPANIAIAAFPVKDGDRIHLSPILPFSERAVYLEGHVARPGRIAYRDGMHLSDVLHSYQDLLPEPAAQGEIVRLVAPDLHAETIDFNVADVLIGNSILDLKPFDTIRVLGRYQVDSPRVTIRGEVLRPGPFPLSEGMTAAQLVRMAGGFKRDALQQEADLTSYHIVDGSKVIGQRSTLRIGDAVSRNDATADVALKPGDILTVHQITGWSDIGASVTIEGEANHPGSYGFQQGERLSSVLRRAGGLRDAAYPAGAVLLREQVRRLEETSRTELIRQIETSSAAARLAPNLSGTDSSGTLQIIQQQQEQVLARLRSQPASGRLVIHIASDIESWANTDADIEVRSGDILTIPKRPGFVLISGQVYNASAITFVPGKSAGWYLQRAGGASDLANRKEIFVIRANGLVVGRHSGAGKVLSAELDAGDVVVVPQKIIGASQFWRNLLTTAQIASSVAITAVVAGR